MTNGVLKMRKTHTKYPVAKYFLGVKALWKQQKELFFRERYCFDAKLTYSGTPNKLYLLIFCISTVDQQILAFKQD